LGFSQRLDTLMTSFSISNSRLAIELSVDPSLVSRWRNGSRTPSRKNCYIEKIAQFFAGRIEKASQHTALLEILNLPTTMSLSNAQLETTLLHWLDNIHRSEDTMIDNMINQLQAFGQSHQPLAQPVSPLSLPEGTQATVQIFYGIQGKQAGVLQFLSLVLSHPSPTTIFLYSDESMDWLTSDPEYYLVWGYIATMMLRKGHRIRIIHTLQRDITEIHEAIERWLPLYMTGSIEPFYYPRYREQIFRRTLFVAPGIASFTSVSLPDTASTAAHQLSTDSQTIQGLAEEFNRFLAFCRPLMKVITGDQLETFPALRAELENQPGNMIASGIFPSSLTLPGELLPDLMLKDTHDHERVITQHLERTKAFYHQIKEYSYSEILFVPREDEFLKHASESDFALNYFTDHLRYSRESLRIHFQHLARLMEEYENFSIFLVPQTGHGAIHLVAKEDVGVLIQKADHPHIAFAFNQSNLTHSFYHYLESVTEQTVREKRNRAYTIHRLRKIAEGI
jgi:transcriptional regulator with XRE-family HTH domain